MIGKGTVGLLEEQVFRLTGAAAQVHILPAVAIHITAAQAVRIEAETARALARASDAEGLAVKVQGAPLPGHADRAPFLEEVEGLRRELAESAEFEPGVAVRAAWAALREAIPFMPRDRAMDGDVATAVQLVRSGKLLTAARHSLL